MTDPTFDRIDQSRLDANWRAIEIELDAPRPSRTERLLRAAGIPAHATRLVVATPALRRAWYLAVAGTAMIALVAADSETPRQSALVFLTVAPLVGVLGVALAFGQAADSAHELHVATPIPGLTVLAIRTLVVSIVSSVVITVLTVVNPVMRPFAAAWLLPAIAVTTTTLALSTWTSPRRAATLAAIAWCSVVLLSQIGVDPLVAFTWIGQVAAVAVAVVAITATVVRRDTFDRLAVAR